MTIVTVISHDFNGNFINQLNEDTLINGVLVPKGYVNATEMCKANKKKWDAYAGSKSNNDYFKVVQLRSTTIVADVIISISTGDNETRGTWVHHLIALHLAQWISADFAYWANTTLWAVVNNDYQALTAEAEEAQLKLQQVWQEIRTQGKVTRRKLTDAINDWYERNPNGTSCPPHVMYALTTNNIYKALWQKDAKQIEVLLGCDRNKSRNAMSAECLMILERAEDRVCEFIDLDNIKPKDAVELAQIRPSRIELN